MGALRHRDSAQRAPLSARTLVGRSGACDLVLDSQRVSGEHARLAWGEGSWWVRDLGSRNGTYVDGERLNAGEERRLTLGQELVFGSRSQRWVLDDDGPPTALARPLSGGSERIAEDGLLPLPDAENPVATLMRQLDGRWQLEIEGEVQDVENLATVVVAGQAWQLFLPEAQAGTRDTLRGGEGELRLRFVVSQDEEHVRLEAWVDGRRVDLGDRAHNYLLLTLARQRLAEAHLPEGERGWMYREELQRGLRLNPQLLNLQVFRARKAFAKADLPEEGSWIERRRDTGQLRLGVPWVEVQRA